MNVMSLTRLGPAMQSRIYHTGINIIIIIIIIIFIILIIAVVNKNNNNNNIHPFLFKQAHKEFINIEKGGT